MSVTGRLQIEDGTVNLIALRSQPLLVLNDVSSVPLLSRDFH